MQLWRPALLLALLSACAMSVTSYERLAGKVSGANDRAYAAAHADLRKKGIVPSTEESRWVSPTDEAQQACLARTYGQLADAGAPPERIRIRVSEAGGADRQAPPPVEVTAALEPACAFLRGHREALEVEGADAGARRILRVSRRQFVARDSKGELVMVVLRPRVTTRRVVVDQECNKMPQVEPDPMERGVSVNVIWDPGWPLRSEDLVYDVEELDVECTRNVY